MIAAPPWLPGQSVIRPALYTRLPQPTSRWAMTSRPTLCLLISRSHLLIDQVKAQTAGAPGVRVEVCAPQLARARVRRPDVGLVLAHLEAIGEDELTQLLQSVAQAGRPCPTVALSDFV